MTFEERDTDIGMIKIYTDLNDMAEAHFVVEAAIIARSSPYWTHVDMVVSNYIARTMPR